MRYGSVLTIMPHVPKGIIDASWILYINLSTYGCMYRSIYVMYTHSYLIALTHSWAPRLRGIVLTTSHAPLYIEISTTDVGLSKSPRFQSNTEFLYFKI